MNLQSIGANRNGSGQNSGIQSLPTLLFRSVRAESLAIWRWCFGLLLLWQAIFYYWPRTFSWHYSADVFHFTYPYLGFIRPLPFPGMQAVVIVESIAALLFAVGYRYRLSASLLFCTYTYVFLIDETHYNNHYYLFCLLLFWSIWLSPQRALSIDSKHKPQGLRSVPFWQLGIIRAHVVLVYFFGGVAKLSSDWLHGEPMTKFIRDAGHTTAGNLIAGIPHIGLVFSYAGLILDLSVGFMLCFKQSRRWALPFLLAFHLFNASLFNIGIFPWFMLASTLLFFPPDQVANRLQTHLQPRKRRSDPAVAPDKPSARRQQLVTYALLTYLVIQVALPLRHFAYPGNTDWTKEGSKFAWRMKMFSMRGHLRFRVVDVATKEGIALDQSVFMSPKQQYYVADEPRLIAVMASFMRKELEKVGRENFIIQCDAIAALNGRQFQYLIAPTIDVSRATQSVWHAKAWIIPLNAGNDIGNYPSSLEEELAEVESVVSRGRAK